jgi:hypothetical protein
VIINFTLLAALLLDETNLAHPQAGKLMAVSWLEA